VTLKCIFCFVSLQEGTLYTYSCFRYVKVIDDLNTTPKNPKLIGSDFKIDLSKVPNYDENAPLKDQYLSVVNYLRSLHIKCNDKEGLEGPVKKELKWNNNLANAAKEHSEDMLANHKMQHLGSGTSTDITAQKFNPPRASTPEERMIANGYDYKNNIAASGMSTGENVAYSASTQTLSDKAWVNAMENWMKSKFGHCSNIMNPNFIDFGMAEARGSENIKVDSQELEGEAAYWTQNFGQIIIYY